MNGRRYIITKYGSGVLAFVFDARTNRMDAVSFVHSAKNTDNITIGDIFVAKVKNVVRQLNAAFIDYMPDQKGYLPIPADYSPILTNRRFDGRILAGDEILVQLEKEAVRTKEPVDYLGSVHETLTVYRLGEDALPPADCLLVCDLNRTEEKAARAEREFPAEILALNDLISWLMEKHSIKPWRGQSTSPRSAK